MTNDKRLVVLIPGMDGTGLLFYRQAPLLAPRFTVVTHRLRDDTDGMDTLVAGLLARHDDLVTRAHATSRMTASAPARPRPAVGYEGAFMGRAFAQREGVTHVIFGQSARSRWELVMRGSTLDKFIGAVPDAAVQVVPLNEAAG